MNPNEIVSLAFKGLKERRLRSALTVTMVVIGVALITALNGMAGGFDAFINQQVHNLSPNLLIISKGEVIRREFGPPREAKITFTDTVATSIKSLAGVREAYPVYFTPARLISQGKILDRQILGVEAWALTKIVPALKLESGRFLNPTDSNVVLLGYNVARPEGEEKPFAVLGQQIVIEYARLESDKPQQRPVTEKRTFIVAGILKPLDQFGDNLVYLTIDSAKSLMRKSGEYDRIYVLTYGLDVNEKVESAIRALYGKDIGITSPQAIIQTVRDLVSGWNAFVSAIGGVSLVVGAVGILAALYTSVLERIKEIGIMKSIGFSDIHLLLLYLGESITIGALGGVLGVGTGIVAAEVLTEEVMRSFQAPPIDPVFVPATLLSIFSLAVFFSAVAGIYPAWRAARLDPVVALRKE